MTLFWFLVLLAPLVFFHELGHFLMAKAFRIKVLVFSLGFGPPVVARKWGETEYRISWLPLGGYVSMLGENPDEEISEEDADRAFSRAPAYKRLLIALAGPLANLLLPIPILFFAFLGQDKIAPPVLGTVLPGYAAYEAGLRSGDTVLSIDGRNIQSFEEFRDVVRNSPGRPVSMTVRGVDGSVRQVTMIPRRTVGRNSVGMKQEVGMAGVLLASTRAVIGVIDTTGPAWQAGLRSGDRIVGIDDGSGMRPIRFWSQLGRYLGKKVKVYYLRGSNELDPSVGLLQATLNETETVLKGIVPGELVVSDVFEDSPAHRWGIKVGDMLYAAARMKEGEPASACTPDYPGLKKLGGSSSFDTFLSMNTRSRFCLVWVSPSPGGSCFHAAAMAQAEVHRVDSFGNKRTTYSFGTATWASYEVPKDVPIDGRVAFAARRAMKSFWNMSTDIFSGIVFMITGKVSTDNVGGPIAIAQMAKEAADRGFIIFLQMMIILSLNLGFLNLLPIPMLDGGHIVFSLLEMVMRRKLPVIVQAIASYIGLSLLVLLMLFAFKNDLVRLFRTKDVVEIKQVDDHKTVRGQLTPTNEIRCLPPPASPGSGPTGH